MSYNAYTTVSMPSAMNSARHANFLVSNKNEHTIIIPVFLADNPISMPSQALVEIWQVLGEGLEAGEIFGR